MENTPIKAYGAQSAQSFFDQMSILKQDFS
jgi:hypothetical protein